MVAFSQLLDLWVGADSDERSRLAASLFQYLVIDLDVEQIVDFRLHAWADQYLCLRAELYEGETSVAFGNLVDDELVEGNENRFIPVESDEAILDPNGLLRRKSLQLRRMFRSIRHVLGLLYPSDGTISIAERNKLVRKRFAAGEILAEIASDYEISPQRISQIVRHK